MEDYYCKDGDCEEIATFGYNLGENIFCKIHMLNDMILSFEQNQILKLDDYDFKRYRKCYSISCDIEASYNFPEIKRAICCKVHCLSGMIDIKHSKCLVEECNIRPTFNLKGLKAVFCKLHKTEIMVDVINRTCEIENCDKIPRYNLTGLKTAIRCFEHREIEMVNVIDKVCNFENCNTQPSYNFKGLKPLMCARHKLNNMIIVKQKKLCEFDNCKIQPYYNFEGLKAIRCFKHKEINMIDVINKKCKNNWCTTIFTNPKYKSYCMRCFIYEFPDQQISRNYKVKERYVTDYIKESFKDYNIIFDKKVGGCSKRRPDAYIDLGIHVIIIEIDENKHKNYDTTCEITRINELFTDLADRSIVFIRFNPDSYIINNVKYSSSFKYHTQSGVPVIRNIKEWNNRLQILKKSIEKNIKKIPTELITFEYLFYDT